MVCFKCGAEIGDEDMAGTAFRSFGNYGSTVFDPFDGSYLDIAICNGCLSEHAARAACGREFRPVICEGLMVGRARTPDRKEVPFDPAVMGSYDADDVLVVDREELGTDLPTVEWHDAAVANLKERADGTR